MHFRWVLVDIETTGLQIKHDKIIEIAISVITETGIVRRWQSLINPEQTVPDVIVSLTNISNAMLKTAPVFEAVAEEVLALLQEGVLVAHNASFDYGFLKNAFKRCNIPFRRHKLCTIKLMKALYPQLGKYSLSALAKHFAIPVSSAHRAHADVDTLHALVKQCFQDAGIEKVLTAAKQILRKSTLPSKLITDISAIPDTPGVYLFYNEASEMPLYIGKSIHLRTRILSHFQADNSSNTEFKIAQQVYRVEVIPTAGELSALLLESQLIKEKMPLLNQRLRRKKTVVGFHLQVSEPYLIAESVRKTQNADALFGAFSSLRAAKNALLDLVKEYALCPKLVGLEQGKGACFSYQLKRCYGACINLEKAEAYNARVRAAFDSLKQDAWPYAGQIVIKEYCDINKLTQFLVFDQWRLQALVNEEKNLQRMPNKSIADDTDTYKILQAYLKQNPDVHVLEME